MSARPHLDAGRIYRLAPFEEVVTELRKVLAASVVPGVAGGNRRNAGLIGWPSGEVGHGVASVRRDTVALLALMPTLLPGAPHSGARAP